MKREFYVTMFAELSTVMSEEKNHLIELDSVVGDGDLGLTMSDGFHAAYEEVANSTETDLGKLLYFAGKKMSTAVPSTMGTLMASGIMNGAKSLRGLQETTLQEFVDFFKGYEEGVALRGKAKVGEKTFIDGIHPAVVSMQTSVEQSKDLEELVSSAEKAALQGYENTRGMLAVHGRAATRGEDSKELLDPGAYVAYLIMKAVHRSI